MRLLCVSSHIFDPTHYSMGAIMLGIQAHAEIEILGRKPRPHPWAGVPIPRYFDPWTMKKPWRPEADLVHSISAGTVSIKVAKVLADDVPYVVSLVGGFDLSRELEDPKLNKGYRNLFRRVDAITVPFHQATTSLLEAGVPRERIVEIPLGLPARKYPRSAPREKKTALWAGRPIERKNRPLAVETFTRSRLLERLIAVGEPDGTEASVNDPRVTFTGALEHSELLPLLASSHLLLQTGWPSGEEYDTLPTVVLEALAVGMPVVSTPLDGVRELAERYPDLVHLGDTAEDLAAACDRVLAAWPAHGTARTVSAEVLADYSLTAAVGRFLQLYRRLLA